MNKPQLVAAVTFQPSAADAARSQLSQFMARLGSESGAEFDDYAEFDRFSVDAFRSFWASFWRWSELPSEGALEPVCVGDSCETAVFFPQLRLNYAECLLHGPPDRPALTACHAGGRHERLTYGELSAKVARLAAALVGWGIGPGDRVAAVARNNAEVVIVALAAAAVGAVVATCTQDMGSFAIRSRLAPLSPSLLFANLAPQPWDMGEAVADRVAEVAAELPSLVAVIALDDGTLPAGVTAPVHRLADLLRDGMPEHRAWPRLPFNHPLFIMFSSGTTGTPKCILHGAGGTLIEHVKEHRLHCDMQAGDRLFFQTSCGWMMWNWQLSALASGTEILVYDGPLERLDTFWQLLADHRVTVFGTNPAYLQYCESLEYSPRSSHDLAALRAILSTGSVLYPRQFHWVEKAVKSLPVQSISGGTDIIGCFVLGNPNLPVRAGEAQCRSLGLDVRVLPPPDDPGARIGELICAGPFPSRPLGFYGDADGTRFHRSYFAAHPGVWTHGDLIERTPCGGWTLHGRSDGILNIRGIRVGPGEIYAILKEIDEVAEAMAIGMESEDEPGGVRMALLVVLRRGANLDPPLSKRIRTELARRGSAALVPARIVAVDALPVTLSGKQSEAAARDAANGRPVRNRDALRNPESLDQIAARLACPAETVQSEATATLEARLTALCESVLRLPSLEPSDSLLELGADSLRVLDLLLAIEKEFGRRLQMSAVLAAPTIAGLARHLRSSPDEVLAPAEGMPGELRIRPATPDDVDGLCQFLESSFVGSGIGVRRWRRLFEYRWFEEAHDRGLVLLAGDEIVGFLGTVHARHPLHDQAHFCNFSSWYVRPQYRGRGIALLVAALQDADTTYTSFTPSTLSQQAFAALQFDKLDGGRILMPLFAHAETLSAPVPRIECEPAVVRGLLDPAEQQVFDDHAPFGCLQLVVHAGAERAYMVIKRRVQRLPGRLLRSLPIRLPYSEVLYCSAPELLSRHLERVKLAVLRRQRTVALVADSRLWPTPPRGLALPNRAVYRSASLEACGIDKLYSELVLLPI